jgi:hypothetical protein
MGMEITAGRVAGGKIGKRPAYIHTNYPIGHLGFQSLVEFNPSAWVC